MKNKFLKWWFLVIAIIPVILMLCLHIGIAIGDYFGININVPNVDASTWFTFAGSYLGGTMTLVGVVITLRHERNVQRYEKELSNIEKEKDYLGKMICELNIFAPSTLYQQSNSILLITKGNDISAQAALIRQQLAKEMQKINKEKLEIMFFTDMYAMTAGCSTCQKPCRIQTILPEFQKIYEKIGSRIFHVLQLIDSYVVINENNAIYREVVNSYCESNQLCQLKEQPPQYEESIIKEYESKIVDVKPEKDEILAAITEISNYSNNEIQQLLALAREYIFVKQQNANKKCFSPKED